MKITIDKKTIENFAYHFISDNHVEFSRLISDPNFTGNFDTQLTFAQFNYLHELITAAVYNHHRDFLNGIFSNLKSPIE